MYRAEFLKLWAVCRLVLQKTEAFIIVKTHSYLMSIIWGVEEVNKSILLRARSVEERYDGAICTTLANDQGAKVSTVEHLLAALYIHGIDNAAIEIDNEEVPIMDGSAKNFLEELRSTDIIEQSKKTCLYLCSYHFVT